MGEPLDDTERTLFRQLTQRDHEPGQRVEEFVGVIGRRGGKSRAISVLASYTAGLCQHPALVSGERGIVLIIAPDQRQAQIVLDYITANLEASPILAQLIESRTQWSLRLSNRIDIEVRASDFRRLRGPSFVFIICDESGFWFNEGSANPDDEILNAVRPGLATTGGSLFMISSPYGAAACCGRPIANTSARKVTQRSWSPPRRRAP
jgi:phage terminase large subunit-like protein